MLISSNPPLIPGIWSLDHTSTMVRQRAATESFCPTKRGTKEVQPGTKQGLPGTKQGQPGTTKGTGALLDKRRKIHLAVRS